MTTAVPVRDAWAEALYGEDGFFLREAPADHFRTSATASPLFAEAVAELALRCDVDTIWDIGAGRGELLRGLAAMNPGWRLHGVEVAPRPAGLDRQISWQEAMPSGVDGLVVANELLDDVPCSVAEVDAEGVARYVLVDPGTGREELGDPLDAADAAWTQQWWPDAATGERVEVGRDRDDAWRDVVSGISSGVAVAIDYGHVRGTRPPFGSMRSYRSGRLAELAWDGTADVTADVALDSVAAACEGRVLRQRDVLHELGIDGTRPDPQLATTDPTAYVQALARAGEGAELTASPGLGDFGWVVTGVGGVRVPLDGVEGVG
jgi:SAM-dependent MidA family methyltransferase